MLPGDQSVSFWITKEGIQHPVLFRSAPDARRATLEALLAVSLLRGRSALGPGFIAMVGAPAISPGMARALEEFMDEVAPRQAFAYVDERGLVRFRGDGLEAIRKNAGRDSSPRAASIRPPNLFSDLNQWLLKILVGQALPQEFLAVPRGPFQTAAELARAGQVSISAAWRLQRALKDEGHLDESGRLLLLPELLSRWRAVLQRSQQRIGAKWLMPGRNPLDRLHRTLAELAAEYREPPACLGLFAACDALGLGHVKGAPVHVYSRSLEAGLLEELGLTLAAEGQRPDLFLLVPNWPEAIFRAVISPAGVPTVDVLQCWLDLSHEPARGSEQAAFLWRRILGPALQIEEP